MIEMASEEERVLEAQLEFQLQEQRDSLADLQEALDSDPANAELLSVREDLILAISDVKEGLLHLKRERLLQEANLAIHAQDVKVESVDPTNVGSESVEESSYSVGSKCRFRHTDGRWYNGEIIGRDSSSAAKVSFLTPIMESMLICKFFLQQRCRFGNNCRLSHGVDVPVSSLKIYVPVLWEQSHVGSMIWASNDPKTGLWRQAELESWDDSQSIGNVVFRSDGSFAKLGVSSLSLSEYALMTDSEDCDSFSEMGSDSSDASQEGFLQESVSKNGIQTETALFAEWENHTRGIASKMMASMGYLEGTGLGVARQGILNPILAKVLPPNQSLDHALNSETRSGEDRVNDAKEKKRSRGGKRKRNKKFAEKRRREKDSTDDVFTLINHQLGGNNGEKEVKKGEEVGDVVAYGEEVRELKTRVDKLEEMVRRNRREKAVYEGAMRKLSETRRSLEEAEAARESASKALASKEKEKRWLKF